MTAANIEMIVPDSFDAVYDIILSVTNYIGADIKNPNSKTISAWNYQGNEIKIDNWHASTILEKNIQGLVFWMPDGNDFFVSWHKNEQAWILTFSESRGNYFCLEKIFCHLVRTAATKYREFFWARLLLNFHSIDFSYPD